MKPVPDSFISDFVNGRLKQEKNNIIAIIGQPGTGKSMASLTLGHMLDKGFSANRVCFSVREVFKLVNSNLPTGSVVILDDAGLAIGNRMWRETVIQFFGLMTQSFRTKFLTFIITVPKLSFIEVQSRSLISLLLQASGNQGSFLVKIPYTPTNFNSKNEITYFIYPYVKKRNGIGRRKLKQVYINLPPKELKNDYEYVKDLHMTKFYKEFEKELEKMENVKEEKKGFNPKSLENLKYRGRKKKVEEE